MGRLASSEEGRGKEGKLLKLEEYLAELEGKRSGKPEQVRDGIEIYVGLWRRAIDRGVVGLSDDLEGALRKVEEAGGLYSAAEE